jgi:hypothetical protein
MYKSHKVLSFFPNTAPDFPLKHIILLIACLLSKGDAVSFEENRGEW